MILLCRYKKELFFYLKKNNSFLLSEKNSLSLQQFVERFDLLATT